MIPINQYNRSTCLWMIIKLAQSLRHRILMSCSSSVVPDFLHKLSYCSWYHILDDRTLRSFECRSSSNRAGKHVFKEHPITHLYFRQAKELSNPIKVTTCRCQCAWGILLLKWFGSLLQKRLYMCTIIKNTIELAIYDPIHVIHKGLFIQFIFIIRNCLFL